MKKRISVLIVAFVLGAGVIGCGSGEPSFVTSETTEITYDLSVVTTIGNKSYIPINQCGQVHDSLPRIQLVLEAFEGGHPELEVVDWELDYVHGHFCSVPKGKTFGIWVDHKPRE